MPTFKNYKFYSILQLSNYYFIYIYTHKFNIFEMLHIKVCGNKKIWTCVQGHMQYP